MDLITKALRFVDPQRAAKRIVGQAALDIAASLGEAPGDTNYDGASRLHRHLRNWRPRLLGARQTYNKGEADILSARSQDLYRNHPIARAAISRVRLSAVGAGVIPHAAVDAEALGISPEAAANLNRAIDREFKLWATDPRECDAESALSFYGLQDLALVSSMVGGDVFSLTPHIERKFGTYGLKLQMVEGWRVSNPGNVQNTSTLVDGVRLDGYGSPVAYHISEPRENDALGLAHSSWRTFPAFGEKTGRRRVLHVWNEKDRPGQVRSAPFLAPIITPLAKLEKYSQAELTAAVVSGLLTVFIEKDAEDEGDLDPTETAPWGGAEGGSDSEVSGDELALGTGAVLDLAPGEKANIADPSRPNANYAPFVDAVMMQIGAALNIPKDELLLHYASSYSAARAAMLQAWAFYTSRRRQLVDLFARPARDLWLDEAVARGRLSLPGYGDPARRVAYSEATWVGPARGAIDELKETKAAAARIDAKLSTRARESQAITGEPWTGTVRQLGAEERALRDEGIVAEEGQVGPPDLTDNVGKQGGE